MTLLGQPPDGAPAPSDITQCASWPIENRKASVCCWTASGQAIRLCGHGLLASAACWADQWQGDGSLTMSGTEIPCRFEGQRIWLGFPPMPTEPCEVLDWLPGLLGNSPVACAFAGGEDDYLIVEMAADACLENLPVPGEELVARTRRALIVTSMVVSEDALCGEQFHYRYFAPQHGVPEDIATGSAMRILAGYWQQRGLGSRLQALQRSAEGGRLWSRMEEGRVWVGGRVSLIGPEAGNA